MNIIDSNPGYLPMLLEEISSTRIIQQLRMVELCKLIERVQEEVVTNENQFGEDKKMKFNIFDVPFVAEEFYETALYGICRLPFTPGTERKTKD